MITQVFVYHLELPDKTDQKLKVTNVDSYYFTCNKKHYNSPCLSAPYNFVISFWLIFWLWLLRADTWVLMRTTLYADLPSYKSAVYRQKHWIPRYIQNHWKYFWRLKKIYCCFLILLCSANSLLQMMMNHWWCIRSS